MSFSLGNNNMQYRRWSIKFAVICITVFCMFGKAFAAALPLPPPLPPVQRATVTPAASAMSLAYVHMSMPPLTPMDAVARQAYLKIWNNASFVHENTSKLKSMIKSGFVQMVLLYANNQKKMVMVTSDGNNIMTAFNRGVIDFGYGSGLPIVVLKTGNSFFSLNTLNIVLNLITKIAFAAAFLFLFYFISTKFFRSNAKRIDKNKEVVTFNDVAGLEEVKAELYEVVDILKNPQRYKQFNASIPRGVLLSGPPGTGKTLLARAVAGEAGVPFYSLNSSDIIDGIIGVAASRVRNLFKQARKKKGGIIFVDEIDLVAKNRNNGGFETDLKAEREHIIDQFMVELDGIQKDKKKYPIILIAATNRPEVLDPAILRPGRIDRRIDVPLPDRNERVDILTLHAEGRPVDDDVDFEHIAAMMPRASGAELANLTNEAAIEAVRRGLNVINKACYEAAIYRIVMGTPRPNLEISADQKKLTCYHEAGHAIAAVLVEDADPPIHATIIPHGKALGLVMMAAPEDEYMISRAKIMARAQVMLAGRAAEIEIYGHERATTGALNDREQVLRLLREMIGAYGLSDRARHIGQITGGFDSGSAVVSQEHLAEFDRALQNEFENVENKITNLIATHKDSLIMVAEALYERKSLSGKEIIDIVKKSHPDIIQIGRSEAMAAASTLKE